MKHSFRYLMPLMKSFRSVKPMTDREITIALENMWVCVDSREHMDSKTFKDRANTLYRLCGGKPQNRLERLTLDYGDYTAKTYDAKGHLVDLSNVVRIERKMGFDELVGNLLQHKERFEKEFTKAKDAGVKMHLVVENASFTKLYNGAFPNHPFVNKKAVTGSFWAFVCRYDLTVHFCKPEQSAQIIYDILSHSLIEYLNPKDAHRFEGEPNGKRRNRRSKTE